MAKTLAEIQAQIESLKSEAERIRTAELSDAIARIRGEIASYGITPQQLFGRAYGAKPARKQRGAAAAYGDGAGNTWGGRGPRPKWLRDALAAGQSLEQFRLGETPVKTKPADAKAAPVKSATPTRAASKRAAKPRRASKPAKRRSAKSGSEAAS